MRRQAQTVASVGWDFIEALERAGSPENTYRVYRSNWASMLDELGGRAITSITPADLGRYCDAGSSEATRKMRRRIANHVMRHAYRRGDVRTLVLVPDPSYRPRQSRNRTWTRYNADQLKSLIESAPCPRSRAAIALGVYTAMRVEDIRLLRAPSPDLMDGWLAAFIHKSKVYDFKVISGGLDNELRRYLTWLYSHVAMKQQEYLIPGYPPSNRADGYLDGIDPSRPISKHALYTRYSEARESAGLPYMKQEKWHTVRRSSARLFFELASGNGYDMALRMTQAFLNHKSVTTTEQYIGLDSAYAMRDDFLRGHDLLGVPGGNVVRLPRSG